MNRLGPSITLVIALFAIATPAQAASKSCQRGGAKLLAASGNVRVVSVKEKPVESETRHDRLYGCWTTTGRRFTLFSQVDYGLDLIESADIEIVGGRYIGIIRWFEGGLSDSRIANTWNAETRRAASDSRHCNGAEVGVEDVVFFQGGGLAYSCSGGLRIADARGDRELEPQGSQVRQLAVAANGFGRGESLYWTADTTPKTLAL